MNMKTYEAIYEPDKHKGVYGISLVENPAMEGLFIALSKDRKIQLKTVDEEKRIIVGLVLEADKPIFRSQDGEEFNMVFSKKTVEELCHGFTENNYNSNSTIEHKEKITGVSFVENWIVRDDKMDTSIAYGLEPKDGDWISLMKVRNDDVWAGYIKTGNVKGFSIDAMLSLKEINLKSEIKMSKENEKTLIDHILELPEKIALAWQSKPKEEVEVKKQITAIQLGEVQTEDKNVTILYDGETMEVGGKVWIVAEDGTEVPLPVGNYKLDGGQVLVVAEEGIIAEVKATEEAPAPEQAPAEMTAKETDATARAIENAIKSIMIKYSEDNDAKLEKFKTELKASFDAKVLELSKQPASQPRRATPTQAEPTNAKQRLAAAINNVKN